MIAILVFPDFQLLDAAGPISVFEVAGRVAGVRRPIRVVSATPGEVRSSSGVAMVAAGLRAAAKAQTVLVAGGNGVGAALGSRPTLSFLRGAERRGCRVASVCSGAYLLAEAGLLDGRRATTHWGRSRDFRARYPAVKLEDDSIFVRDGAIWTSAGISAGIDLALAMVAADFGDDVARQTARWLVVHERRSGGQSQFSSLLELKAPEGRFAPLLSWARPRLAQRLTVDALAEQAGMSPRHFTRAFQAETGMTPARAIERLRVEAARERVRGGSEPIEQVALGTGFGDAERMRRAFIRAFGQPPQALRRTARAA